MVTFRGSPNLHQPKSCGRIRHLTQPGPPDGVTHLKSSRKWIASSAHGSGPPLTKLTNTTRCILRSFQAKPRPGVFGQIHRKIPRSRPQTARQPRSSLRPSPILLHACYRRPVYGRHAVHPRVHGRVPSQSLTTIQPYASARERVRGSPFEPSQERSRIWRPPGRKPAVLAT